MTNTGQPGRGSGNSLRAYVYVDKMQPTWAAYVGRNDPRDSSVEGMAQLYVEVAPATLVFSLANAALKNTSTASSMLVAERRYGTLELHAANPDAVRQAGTIILAMIGSSSAPGMVPSSVTTRIVNNVTATEAALVNRMGIRARLEGGDAMLVVETEPAAYVALAANEVEKHTSLRMVLVRLHGASGRLILAGSEAEVEIGHRVALEALGGE
ncbi:MAG: hypothetical protein OXF41_15365 [bacterium]|nr:hypothetical protein [bacterium]